MKTRKLLSLTSAIAAVLLVGTLGLHATQVVAVSVNFTGNGNGGIDNGQADSLTNLVMDPTGATVEQAGAPGFAVTNWNNIDRWVTLAPASLITREMLQGCISIGMRLGVLIADLRACTRRMEE